MPRNVAVVYREHGFHQPGDTGRRFQVTEIGLHRSNHQLIRTRSIAENLTQ